MLAEIMRENCMGDAKETTRCGRCLCGSIQYEVTGEPEIVAHCHCEDCQRFTGAGHSTVAMYAKKQFLMTGGTIGEFKLIEENGYEVTRGFCASCGSPIYSHNSGNESYLSVTLGTLEDSSDLKPEVVIFSRNRKPWDAIDETIQSFEAKPDWKPDTNHK